MTAARTLLAASLLILAAAVGAPTWAQNPPAAAPKRPAAAAAPPAPAQRSQQQDRGSQQAFEQGKAVGQAAAKTTQTDLSTGRAQEVVRSTIQGYTADPPARASYAAQSGASQGAQMRAACAAGQAGTDAATCEAIEVGGRPRDLSGTRPNDPALAGQAAVSRPERVLGDMAQTYNACSVGGSLQQSPDWQAASCQLGSHDWSEHVCTKRLSLRPVQTQTCAEGAVIAGGVGVSPGTTDNTTGPWSVRLAGYCSLPTGAKPMRFVAEGDATCGEPVKHDLDLYTLPGANELPRELSPVAVRKSDGSCASMPTYVLGRGCVSNACHVEAHFSPTGYERINRCPVGVIGTSISFANWTLGKAQANAVCLTPFPSRRIAEIFFGRSVSGDTGVQIGVGVSQFWVPIAASVFDHVEWPQDQVEFDMAFTLPRVFPPSGDLWSSGCAALEARTRALPPDGTRVSLPLLPMLGDSPGQQCLLKSSTCLDGPSDKVINGKRVSRACWTWRNTFACTTPVPAANCRAARDPSCAPSGQPLCLQEDGRGRCLQAREDFACKASSGSFTDALNCGPSSFCANGSCWNSDDTANRDNPNYAMAMAQFQARAEAAKDIELEPLKVHIFKGRDLRCRRDNFGLDNCCADAGVTQRCTAEEGELKTLNDEGRCVQVGDYCSRRNLFGCRERTRTHCCFNSVLGRLIQQQGRNQLGKSWFSDNGEPDCGGLTPAELAAVDWSRLDLREYYAQLRLDPKPLEQASVTQGADAAQGRCYYGDGKC